MDTLERLRDAADAVFDPSPVVFAYLFGSQARGAAGPGSDVDVGCYLDPATPADAHLPTSLRLADELERACGCGPVEALVVLNTAPLRLVGRVLADREVVYSRDEPLRVRWESRLFRMAQDFEVHARRLDQQMLRAIAEGRR